MKQFPIIIIRHNEYLDKIFTFYVKNSPDTKKGNWHKWTPPKKKYLLNKVHGFQKEWGKYKKEILLAMREITGLSFQRNRIDVFIVSGVLRTFSEPIVMDGRLKNNSFVDILTHELIHLLIADGLGKKGKEKLNNFIEKLFPNRNEVTKSHIMVFAILKYIQLKVFKDKKRVKDDIERAKKHGNDDYTKAWEIVNKHGHLKIIKKIKAMFIVDEKKSVR